MVAAVLMGLIWYGIWTAAAVGLFALATSADRFAEALPGVLLFILAYWQLSPLLTASMGFSIDLRKMALYPIRSQTLFVVECALRLLNGLEMLLLLAGLAAGAMAHAPGRAALFLPATAIFILFNVLLSAGLRNLLERLLQRRRLREVLVFIVVMASVTPQLLLWSGSAEKLGERVQAAARFLPQSLLPSTSVARCFTGASRPGDWLVLAAWTALAGWFGYWQFRRSLRSDPAARPAAAVTAREHRPSWTDRLYALPGRVLPDPLAGLAEKELRYFWRSPRFRLLFIMGFSFGVVAWLPIGMRRGGPSPIVQSSFLTLLSLYALLMISQVTALNSFGFDRSAVRYFFWMPTPLGWLLAAKNIVAAILILLEIGCLAVICRLLGLKAGIWQAAEAIAVTMIAALYLFAAGNFSSILFPAAMSPERVSRGAAARGVQGLVVLLFPVLLFPIVAAYFARYYWESMRWFVAFLAIAAAGGTGLYAVSLPLAARMAYRRREHLLQELSRGEGPLVGG